MYENKYAKKTMILALVLVVGYYLLSFVLDNSHKWTRDIREYRSNGYRVIDTQGQLASDDCYSYPVEFNSNGIRLGYEGFVDVQGNKVYEKASARISNLIYLNWPLYDYCLDDDVFAITNSEEYEMSVHIIHLESGDEYIVHDANTALFNGHFSEGLLIVQDRDTMKKGYVDKFGQWIIEPGFEDACNFSDGLALVKENDLYGYIDHNGNYVIPPQFLNASSFSEGYAAVTYDECKYGYIDKQGNMIIEPQYKHAGSFTDGLARVFDYSRDRYGYINSNGDVVIDFQFEYADDFCFGLASVYDSSAKKYGYIDTNGNIVIPCQFERAHSFTADGLARVDCDNDNSSYIDRDGNFLFKPQLAPCEDFKNGYACIYLGKGKSIDYSDSLPAKWKEEYAKKIKIYDFIIFIYVHEKLIVSVIGILWLFCFAYYFIKCSNEEVRIRENNK